jgi:malate synthase
MPGPNQIHKMREDVQVTGEDLLQVPDGEITERGLRHNIDVGIRYMEAWLSGNGCVPIYNLMEDAATAEISRSQIWQWIHQPGVALADGREITPELCHALFGEEMDNIESDVGEKRFAAGRYELARKLIERIAQQDSFTEFMTTVGYEHLD